MARANRYNARWGREAENQLAEWLRANGFPDAQVAAKAQRDRGDIAGVPGCCVEVKALADPMRGLRDGQSDAVKEAFGRRPVAVVRLPGVTDPARWWAATIEAPEWEPQHAMPDALFWLGMEASRVKARCSAAAVAGAIDSHGAVFRGDWLVTEVGRLFPAMREET